MPETEKGFKRINFFKGFLSHTETEGPSGSQVLTSVEDLLATESSISFDALELIHRWKTGSLFVAAAAAGGVVMHVGAAHADAGDADQHVRGVLQRGFRHIHQLQAAEAGEFERAHK